MIGLATLPPNYLPPRVLRQDVSPAYHGFLSLSPSAGALITLLAGALECVGLPTHSNVASVLSSIEHKRT